MDKTEFMLAFCEALADLPEQEREKACSYYSGMIAAKVAAGKTEEEAIKELGGADGAAISFLKQKLSENAAKGHPIRALRTVVPVILMLLGLGILWAFLICLYAVLLALCLSFVFGFFGGIVFCFVKTVPIGLCLMGGGIITLAVGLLLFYPVSLASRLLSSLSHLAADKIRRLFAKEALTV